MLADGTAVSIRPIRPEDAAIEQEFVRKLSHESRYFRFMDTVRELSPRMLAHFTQVDYDRHMALTTVTERDGRESARFDENDPRIMRVEIPLQVGAK